MPFTTITAATAMRRFLLATLVPAALLLSGCASDEPPVPCPPVGSPAPLDRVTRFDGSGRDLTQVRFTGRVDGVDLACEYDEKGVDVELKVRLVVERGPADQSRRAGVQYFVAVEDAPGSVTAKQVFDLEVPFEGNIRRVARIDELSLRIPTPKQGFRDTRVLVGFQLTPEQLEYNRSQKQ